LTEKLEPTAPSGQRRLGLVDSLAKEVIPVGVRFDPIFPELTEDEIPAVVKKISEAGAEHIVSSTFKARGDSWKRFKLAFPDTADGLEELYFEKGEKIDNSYYLPREMRMNILEKVAKECDEHNISFATCREGFFSLQTSGSCDGSHLIG
ncbi:MAG: radical SAM protein, partial [Candidatus Thermoplasmatota archaeon]